jgi:hypothetical protein
VVASSAATGVATPAATTRDGAVTPATRDGAEDSSPLQVARPRESEAPAPNAIYLEALGSGFIYSLNYERLVVDQLGVRVGFGYWWQGAEVTTSSGTTTASGSFLTVPITVSYLGLRSGRHVLELGAGMALIHLSGSISGLGVLSAGAGTTPVGEALIGYRIQPMGAAGLNFRVGAMALVGQGLGLSAADPKRFVVLPWGYVSFGASF